MPVAVITDRDFGLLSAIRVVYFTTHNLLCIWHVDKNVLAHCKESFPTKEEWDKFYEAWQKVIYSNTRDAYIDAWIALQDDYYAEHLDVVGYLEDTWIRPFVRKIVRCYTNKILHFKTTITSRSEGAHRVLKHNLGFSTGDLKTVVDNIEILLMNQRKEYKIKIDEAKMRLPYLSICKFHYFAILSHVLPYMLCA